MNKKDLQTLLMFCISLFTMGSLFASSTFTGTWHPATIITSNDAVPNAAPPVISCPPNQVLSCFETIPEPAATVAEFVAMGGTIVDNCTSLADIVLVAENTNNGGDNCPGNARIVVRTYSATDLCGNVSSCQQTFTYLASTQGPVITSVLPTCYKFCASLANPMASDVTFETDCSFDAIVNITGPTQIGAANCPGSIYRYTYRVTDDCGRISAPVTRDFIIGNDAPTIQCPPFNLILQCGDPNNQSYINTHLQTVTANTSCELGYTINHFPQTFNLNSCNSATVVTFVATDACGRTASCTTTIAVQDNTPPTFTNAPTLSCEVIECGADAQFFFQKFINSNIDSLEAADACDTDVSITVVNPQLNQTCSADGKAVTVVTFRATDNCNNSTTITRTFTIQNTAPALFNNIPPNATVSCGSPLVFGPAPTVTEICQTTVTFADTVNDTDPCNVINTRTWTATDACGGLTTSVSQSITEVDNLPPAAPVAPANVNVECASDVPAPVNLTAIDLCQGAITVSPSAVITPGNCDNQFTMVRTWTFADACGNQSSVSQTISVNDSTPPAAPAAPADVTVQCASDLPAPIDLTAQDNCSGSITVSPSAVITPGDCDDQFTMVRTWTFVDDCGNQSSVSQTITVFDDAAPTFTFVPAGGMIGCGEVPVFGTATATDNCSGVLLTFEDTQSGDNCNIVYTRTWLAVDLCGNSEIASQTFTASDTEAPTFTFVPADYDSPCIDEDGNITVYAQVCASSDDAEEDESNGNEGKVNLTSTDLEMSLDDSQNKNVKVGVRFKDLNIPAGAIITSAYIQFTADATIDVNPSQLTIHGEDSDNATTFLKQLFNISNRPQTDAFAIWNPGDWLEIGDNLEVERTPDLTEIVQEIVDRAGFTSASAMAFIIEGFGKRTAIAYDLNPNQAPELYVTYQAGDLFGTPTATDDCAAVTITFEDTTEGDCAGSKTRTWTATDACGQSTTAAQTVHFSDNVPPVFTFVPASVLSDCDYQVFPPVFGTPEVEDNCGGTVTITFEDYYYEGYAGSCDDEDDYEYRRKWTATDACGNTTTAVQNYDVNGDDYSSFIGFIYTEEEAPVEDVQVTLSGFNGFSMLNASGGNGTYGYSDLVEGANYTVTPMKNVDPLNGVSSFDLVLMSKHILQIQLLDSPYKMIAADINRSGSITTMDMVELRKMILHITDDFTNNTSWRFIESNYSFPQPNNPFATIFPEETYINGLVLGQEQNYIGVKIGDVNGSAVANSFMAEAANRTAEKELTFVIADAALNAGDTYEMVVRAADFNNVSAYQYTMNFDANQLELVDMTPAELPGLSESNFGFTKINEGALTTSWNSDNGVSMDANAPLFTLTFKAKETVKIAEALTINSRYTSAEAYDAAARLMKVNLRCEGDTTIVSNNEFTLCQNQPNPFKANTTIGFHLPEAATATLTIYDISGRVLREIKGDFAKGYSQLSVETSDLQRTGVVYYRLVTAGFEATKKMMIVE